MIMDVAEICERLNDKAESLAPQLLPNGRRSGNYWMASGIDDTGQGASLAVQLSGPRIGRWRDYGNAAAGEERGDMLDLVQLKAKGYTIDKAEAVAWAKSFLGIADVVTPGRTAPPSDAERQRRAEAARQRAAQREERAAEERAKRIRKAQHLYHSARAIAGTPADLYLRGRMIDPAGRWPGSLRFHDEAWCGPLGGKYPAMVAPIFTAQGELVGVHRTFLQQQAGGRWGKLQHADLDDPKMVLGTQWGGFIPINKGASGKSMRHMPEGEPVYVTEGIEDALCVRAIKPEARIVCALNLGNIGAMLLPAPARQLVIVADRDEKADPVKQAKVQEAFERAVGAQQARGVAVQIVLPPREVNGRRVKDINDWVQALRAGPERRSA